MSSGSRTAICVLITSIIPNWDVNGYRSIPFMSLHLWSLALPVPGTTGRTSVDCSTVSGPLTRCRTTRRRKCPSPLRVASPKIDAQRVGKVVHIGSPQTPWAILRCRRRRTARSPRHLRSGGRTRSLRPLLAQHGRKLSWICDSSVLLAQGTHRACSPPAVDAATASNVSTPSHTRARYSIFIVSDICLSPFPFRVVYTAGVLCSAANRPV